MTDIAASILEEMTAALPSGEKPTWKYAEKLPPARTDKPWMPGVKKLSYTHQALVDLVITNPELTQAQYAAAFGYSETWLSAIVQSDAFREEVAKRRHEILRPEVVASIEEKFKIVIDKSLGVVMRHLEASPTVDLALQSLSISARALGYGARGPQVQVNNNFVVEVPPKSRSAREWAERHAIPGEAVAVPAAAA